MKTRTLSVYKASGLKKLFKVASRLTWVEALNLASELQRTHGGHYIIG